LEKVIYTNSRGQSIELGNYAPYILTKLEGTGAPKTTILTSKSPGQDGKTYHGTLLEERNINIEGSIEGISENDLFKKRKFLCSIFNPKLSGVLMYINNEYTYKIDCEMLDTPTFKDKFSTLQPFLLQLYCHDPYWLDIYESTEEIAVWLGDIQFPMMISDKGTEMGHRESNLIVNLNNSGDISCGMRIEFTALATVVNPVILNVNTQEYIKIKRTLSAGDILKITTYIGNKKVELIRNGIISNVFNYIDLESTFLQLEVGDNLLRYDAENGIDNLEVRIYYRQKYIGV
jgi:hypothetical protein